jgi:hypothetical protein
MGKRKQKAAKPACLEGKWTFDRDVPTYDFFEGKDLTKSGDLEEVVSTLANDIEDGHFLRWEAVVCQELGLPLTQTQEGAIDELFSFGGEGDKDRILYINEIPRPSQLWYEIVRETVPHLLVAQFKTYESHYGVTYDGWKTLVEALEKSGDGLSLPPGVGRPVDVVPIDLQHRLWLQTCLGMLGGLGQAAELTLRNEEQQDRIPWFIRDLREHKESVEMLDLTLERLLTVLVLPPDDEPIFIEMVKGQLGLDSMTDRIAVHL